MLPSRQHCTRRAGNEEAILRLQLPLVQQENAATAVKPGVAFELHQQPVQLVAQFLIVARLPLVEDHKIDQHPAPTPIDMRLHQLFNQPQPIFILNRHQKDRIVARYAEPPKVGLPARVGSQNGWCGTQVGNGVKQCAQQRLEAFQFACGETGAPQFQFCTRARLRKAMLDGRQAQIQARDFRQPRLRGRSRGHKNQLRALARL